MNWLQEIGFTGSDGKDQHQRIMASLDMLADAIEHSLSDELLQLLFVTNCLSV